MSFNVKDLPDPENRTAAQWVTFYLRVENSGAQGVTVSVAGRTVVLPSLEAIVAERMRWQQKVSQEAEQVSGRPANPPIYLGIG